MTGMEKQAAEGLQPPETESVIATSRPEPSEKVGRIAPATPTPLPPPNGGAQAWLQVLGAWCHWFVVWGVILSFGVFQEYYQKTYLKDYSPSEISWIGTIQACLTFGVGAVVGPVFDRGYMRTLIAIGTVLVTLGLMTASVASQYYSIFLSLGLCTGVGMGCLWLPSITVVGTYFTTKRPLAGSLAATGAGVGNVLYSAVFRSLVDAVGFAWTIRIIAFIDLAFMLLALVFLRQRPSPQRPRALIDWSAFREPRFNYCCAAQFFLIAAVYVPFFYIAIFAELELNVPERLSYSMISILATGSIFGRLALGYAASQYGIFPTFVFGAFFIAMLMFIWGAVHNLGGLVAYAIFYGAITGGVAGTRSGMVLVFVALGVLVGNPIAGAILDSGSGFAGVQGFAGAFMLVGTILMFLSWQAVRKHEKEVAGS